MLRENLINIYETSFRENYALPALTDYFKQENFTYLEMGAEIAKLHLLFDEAGIRQGDRIALIGRNLLGARRFEYVSDYLPTVSTAMQPSLMLTSRWTF